MKNIARKTIYSFLSVAIAVMIISPYFFSMVLFGFYSDSAKKTTLIETGSVRPVIENLKLEKNGVEKTEEEINQSSNFLRLNSSCTFSFSIRNAGRSDIAYSIDIQIAWDEELKESKKLLVYHDEISDEAVYQNLQSGNSDGAVIGFEALDEKEVFISTGTKQGISETIDSEVLQKSENEETNKSVLTNAAASFKDYKFKLFFYEDADVTLNPGDYHSKSIEVNLIVNAVLNEREANWTGTEKKSFSVISVIDTIYPVIQEVFLPKTYFITKAQGIDLTAYASASDAFDGDITGKIRIDSSPLFDPLKAGVYNIIYTVTNSLGNAASPLNISIVVWDFVKITSGYYHTLALTSYGKVYVWGYNYYGQLGDGTYTDRSTPKQLEGLSDIIDVAAGVGCSYALTSDGQAYSWGRNENGRLGDNTTAGKNTPVKVLQPAGVKFVQISARFATAGGLTAEGDVYTWGYGGYGTAGTNKTGDLHIPTKIELSDIAQIELGYYNGAAVSKDGQVYTWGSNTYGALGTGAASSNGPNPIVRIPYFSDENIKMKQVSVGYYHMAGVSEDGRLFTWGYGLEGRLGNGSTSNKFVPQLISLASSAKKAIAGYYHTGVLTNGGTAYFFGQNIYGKHGSGNTTNHLTPYELTSVSNITDISLAYDSSFVLSSGTDVYGMGYGGTGVLGTGNNSNSNIAVKWAFIPPEPLVRLSKSADIYSRLNFLSRVSSGKNGGFVDEAKFPVPEEIKPGEIFNAEHGPYDCSGGIRPNIAGENLRPAEFKREAIKGIKRRKRK